MKICAMGELALQDGIDDICSYRYGRKKLEQAPAGLRPNRRRLRAPAGLRSALHAREFPSANFMNRNARICRRELSKT